jgi:metallo-beta-lactamase family protein
MKLTFYGATQTVTGSKYLLEDGNNRTLLDCGLFQGLKELRLRNWDKLPFEPSSIDNVVLTHAHIDHSGALPMLVRDGFKGRIYSSSGTADLCDILLPDSGRLHEEDAYRANKYGYTKHHPAKPLYTEDDAYKALEHFFPVSLGKEFSLGEELSFSLMRAGHILGANIVRFSAAGTSIVFSGDLGRLNDPIMHPPAEVQDTDYLVLESTYGNRKHEDVDPQDIMKSIINNTVSHGGKVLIPAFAVGRAQLMLYHVYQLKKRGEIPNVPVFLDSPMSIKATRVLQQHLKDHKLSEDECNAVCGVAEYLKTPEESKSLNETTMPMIIISASGMATGGRVLHHLKNLVGDKKNTVLFAGFQAAGTRGERLVNGEDRIKIHGDLYPVRARIENLANMSAHADYEEILEWLSKFRSAPKTVFLSHGEIEAAQSLKEKIEDRFGWNVVIPEYEDSFDL